jgi:hypothetical protein
LSYRDSLVSSCAHLIRQAILVKPYGQAVLFFKCNPKYIYRQSLASSSLKIKHVIHDFFAFWLTEFVDFYQNCGVNCYHDRYFQKYPNRIHPVPETFRIQEKKLIWNYPSHRKSRPRTCAKQIQVWWSSSSKQRALPLSKFYLDIQNPLSKFYLDNGPTLCVSFWRKRFGMQTMRVPVGRVPQIKHMSEGRKIPFIEKCL